jgi:hypothetical protein
MFGSLHSARPQFGMTVSTLETGMTKVTVGTVIVPGFPRPGHLPLFNKDIPLTNEQRKSALDKL